MTVRELIRELSQLPQDVPILIGGSKDVFISEDTGWCTESFWSEIKEVISLDVRVIIQPGDEVE
jgi:hypothetical protein